MLSRTGRSAIFLLFSLCVIPALFSYFNLISTLNHHDICIVDPVKNHPPHGDPRQSLSKNVLHDMMGVYQTLPGSNYYLAKTSFDTSHSCLFSDDKMDHEIKACGWPSSPTILSLLSPRTMALKKDKPSTSEQTDPPSVASSIYWNRGHVPLAPGKNRWCLTHQMLPDKSSISQLFTEICTPEVASIISNPNQEPYFPEVPLDPPPRGHWGNATPLRVNCYLGSWNNRSPVMSDDMSLTKPIWNPMNIPCTALLILLQLICFMKSSSEERGSMGVSYKNVVEDGELWRIYKSAFTHGDFKHLLFNIYSFYIVGACLEKSYGSIPFLNLNLALIFVTTAFTLVIATCFCHTTYPKSRIIMLGYSTISFAWSTVVVLERAEYPILPWNSFPNEGNFNVIPILQLLLSYVAFPHECSFLSSIIGFIIGLFVHWNIPDQTLLVPHLLIPFVLLIDCYLLRKIIPLERSLDHKSYVFVSRKNHDFSDSSSYGSDSDEMISRSHQFLLSFLRNAMIAISIISIFALDHAMAVSQCLITLFFYYSIGAIHLDSSNGFSLMRA